MPRVLATVLCGLAFGLVFGCTPSGAFCERQRECASDPPGEDFIAICTATYDGQIRALRANKEEECQSVADAKMRYDACVVQLEDCEDFLEAAFSPSAHEGDCKDEAKDYLDALKDAESECSTLD